MPTEEEPGVTEPRAADSEYPLEPSGEEMRRMVDEPAGAGV